MATGDRAPFRADLAEGPEGGYALWLQASDGTRLRAGIWPAAIPRGTVLLFPGRTEYIEKYGRVARDLVSADYAVVAIDWRGQGFSDRLVEDDNVGHVWTFLDYQQDVAELTNAATAAGLPRPWHLLAHSMGGCIGLRALIDRLPVAAAAFSAPMWGIRFTSALKPVAKVLPSLAGMAGLGLKYAPGTRPTSYLTDTDFESNMLTSDRDHFFYLGRHVAGEPKFSLGGPSLHWLGAAQREMAALEAMPRPAIPVLTMIGTDEQIVDPAAVARFHKTWPSARLETVEGARHELMMEAPDKRGWFLRSVLDLFAAHEDGRRDPRDD